MNESLFLSQEKIEVSGKKEMGSVQTFDFYFTLSFTSEILVRFNMPLIYGEAVIRQKYKRQTKSLYS